MEYTVELIKEIRHRYIMYSTLTRLDSSKAEANILTLLDTGAFNSMIDVTLAKRYGLMLPITIPISIGGSLGGAQACILHSVTLGNFKMSRVFALAFPFKDWLTGHIILGANVLNNWDLFLSRTNNAMHFSERIPTDVPNKGHPYQNYFTNGEYVAVQDDTNPYLKHL